MLKVDQVVRAAREVIVQDATSNVRNIRERRASDAQGVERTLTLTSLQWSAWVAWSERADPPEAVAEIVSEARSRLSHPSAVKP